MPINFIEMGIYYGDVHYGIRISKKVVIDGDICFEPIYELLFEQESREDVLKKVADMYSNLSDPGKYRYELLVDVFTTHDGPQGKKGWQVITAEQMIEFIGGMYKISRG